VGDGGLGVGVGGWVCGYWALGPFPNPQSPIPNPQSPIPNFKMVFIIFKKIILKKK